MLKIKEFISLQEGKIFLLGLFLLFIYISVIFGMYFIDISTANNLIGMSIAHSLFGRAAGISYGYTASFSDLVIIISNMIIEFIIVMLIYPIFVLSWNNSYDIKFLKNITDIVQKQREKYKFFLFVWFPFWMTGPVIGSILGFLIGVRHYTTMFVVLSGTSLAVVVWTYFLKELISLLNQISSYAPFILLVLFVVLAIFLRIKAKKKNTN